jgi:hypothetical protein
MREAFRSLNWRKLIMVSVLLGGLIGAFAPQGIFTRTAFMYGYGGGGSCPNKIVNGQVVCQWTGGCALQGNKCIYAKVYPYNGSCPDETCQ